MGIDSVIDKCPVDSGKIERQTNWPITTPLDCSIAKQRTPVKCHTCKKTQHASTIKNKTIVAVILNLLQHHIFDVSPEVKIVK